MAGLPPAPQTGPSHVYGAHLQASLHDIPLVGQILGNGDSMAVLIGVTYRLAGEAGEPQLQINPFSAVAPGIFRSVFEYN